MTNVWKCADSYKVRYLRRRIKYMICIAITCTHLKSRHGAVPLYCRWQFYNEKSTKQRISMNCLCHNRKEDLKADTEQKLSGLTSIKLSMLGLFASFAGPKYYFQCTDQSTKQGQAALMVMVCSSSTMLLWFRRSSAEHEWLQGLRVVTGLHDSRTGDAFWKHLVAYSRNFLEKGP